MSRLPADQNTAERLLELCMRPVPARMFLVMTTVEGTEQYLCGASGIYMSNAVSASAVHSYVQQRNRPHPYAAFAPPAVAKEPSRPADPPLPLACLCPEPLLLAAAGRGR